MLGKLFLRLIVSVVFLASFFCIAPVLQSCSEGPDPFSFFTSHPDVPLEKFAAGRIGIVQPTFARSYLVVAYRYFAGVPLSKDEQFGARDLWSERIGNGNVVEPYLGVERPTNPYVEDHAPHGGENWLEARKQVTGAVTPQIASLKDGPNYNSYANCSDDALETAAITLNARVRAFGKDHLGVKDWLRAQDAVFINCGNPSEPVIPDPPPASLPEILRFDREYQIAAAHFYGNQFAAAESDLKRIAEEEKSPWHEIAPYLVARNLARRASLEAPSAPQTPETPGFNSEFLKQAEAMIQNLLRDPRQKSLHDHLRALLDRVEFHLHPAAQTLTLSQRLRTPAPEGKFYQWLWDYTLLLDLRRDSLPGQVFNPGAANAQAYADATPERSKDDLTDWIVTLQAENPSATAHALESWRSHQNSIPWLLVLLSKTEANSPFFSEVLAAADRIPNNSPAYLTAFFHRMRIRNGEKQFAEVRKSLDSLFKSSLEIPRVSKEALLDQRLDVASDLEDFVHFLGRSGCPPDQDAQPSSCIQVLGPHGSDLLDAMPLDSILQAYRSAGLSQDIKNQIARNIWMRAVILNRHDVAQSLDATIPAWNNTAVQGIKPEYIAELIKQYESASSPEEKQFAALFFLQHQYAYGFEMGTTEPWCASPRGSWHDSSPGHFSRELAPPPPFLTSEQSNQTLVERAALDNTDSQANYYTKIAIEFAQKHPDDPRVPESLSRAVKNTNRNCNNPRTGALSKKAFDLLHDRYPNTSWAKNTKYWYGGSPY